jgi:hypothetical protein
LTFYGFVPGKSKEFAKVNVPASASDVGDLKKQFYREFPVALAGVDPSQFHLELVPVGTTEQTVDSVLAAGKTTKLKATATLAEAGITQGALIVAVLPAPATIPQEPPKKITICSYDGDTERDVMNVLTVRSQKHLDTMLSKERAHGLDRIDVPENEIVDQHGKLVDGGHYIFCGDSVTARKKRQLWYQQMDRQLERDATALVKRAMEEQYGPLAEYTWNMTLSYGDSTQTKKKGEEQEYDGLLVNSSSVLFVEAKHSADKDHPHLIMRKKEHLEEYIKRTNDPQFESIPKDGTARIIPFFATRSIKQDEEKMFFEKGIRQAERPQLFCPPGQPAAAASAPLSCAHRQEASRLRRSFCSFQYQTGS